MRLAVIGSRGFENYDLLKTEIDKLTHATEILSGGAKGADRLAEAYAKEHGLPIHIFLPDWSKGMHAGFLRNNFIINACEVVIAFWDGASKGTLDSMNKARRSKKQVIEIIYETNTQNRIPASGVASFFL